MTHTTNYNCVIFLDCDGVLALTRSLLCDYEDGDVTLLHDPTGSVSTPLEKYCVDNLIALVKKTGMFSLILHENTRVNFLL